MKTGHCRPLSFCLEDMTQATSEEAMTHFLCLFVTRRPVFKVSARPHPQSHIRSFMKANKTRIKNALFMDLIEKSFSDHAFCTRVLMLLEENYGDSQDVFDFLLSLQGDQQVSHFQKFVRSMGERCGRPDWSVLPRTLFDGSFLRELRRLAEQKFPFYEIGGRTNTSLETYRWCFEPGAIEKTGFESVRRSTYDLCFDLGGGYATPFLASRFQKPLVCLDICDPNQLISLDPESQTEYRRHGLELGSEPIPFIYFDVFKSKIPTNADTYLITSFGFLGSTISEPSQKSFGEKSFAPYRATLASARLLSQLIFQGKKIDLCVYARPSKAYYSNICYTLRFRESKLVSAQGFYTDYHKFIPRVPGSAITEPPYKHFDYTAVPTK